MKKQQTIISLEGIDGAGKTTLINFLKQKYGEQACVYSRTCKKRFGKFLIEHFPLNNCMLLQIPFYLLLSYINFFRCKGRKTATLILMDRCFLSNICYFYPSALHHELRFKLAMLFEIKLKPSIIIIIDEDPYVAQKRDQMKKEFCWLETTREHYLSSIDAAVLKEYEICLIPMDLSIVKKEEVIVKVIDGIIKETEQ